MENIWRKNAVDGMCFKHCFNIHFSLQQDFTMNRATSEQVGDIFEKFDLENLYVTGVCKLNRKWF